jgi:hypothetical protein
VSETTNSIEINGKRYDTTTGLAVKPNGSAKTGGSLDGVISKTSTKVTLAAPRTKPTVPITPLSASKLMDAVLARPTQTVALKHSASVVPADRLARAVQANQSSHISRFTKHQAPAAKATPPIPSAAVTRPVAPPQRPLDVFEIAMQRATSHEQLPVIHYKHPRSRQLFSKRRTSIAATAVTILLVVGLIGFQYRTTIALHLATGKAGFRAVIPAYQPSGFSIGKLNASAGTVAINFHSNSDQRSYAITEKPSAWDSATLRDNFVASADSHYQSVQVGGRTVYLYGKNNAAWVNGGIWYQVQSGGALSDHQLSELAASL